MRGAGKGQSRVQARVHGAENLRRMGAMQMNEARKAKKSRRLAIMGPAQTDLQVEISRLECGKSDKK